MTEVVFLHGVGSSGAAMRPLASALGLAGNTHFPDGPQSFDMGPGRQWFSVQGITEENRPSRIAAALPAFRAVLETLGDPRETVLIGFSQGAIMALHAVADGLPVRAVFALSGRLAGPVVPARTGWPPITLLHGAADPVIPAQMALSTRDWLRAAGATPELRVLDGLGHSVDERGLSFLRHRLAGMVTLQAS